MSALEAIGLGLSVVAVYISWRAYHRDTAKIKFVEFSLETSVVIEDTQFCVLIVNVGRRTVLLESTLLRFRWGGTIELPWNHLPHRVINVPRSLTSIVELEEGQKLYVYYPVYQRNKSMYVLQHPPYDIIEVVFIDTNGKKYRKKAPRSLRRRAIRRWPKEINAPKPPWAEMDEGTRLRSETDTI